MRVEGSILKRRPCQPACRSLFARIARSHRPRDPSRRPVCAPTRQVLQFASQTVKEIAMKRLFRAMQTSIICAIAALLLGVAPAIALSESVIGHGKVLNGGGSPSQISVHAWRDTDGSIHGSVTWIGDITPGIFPKGGIADPWFL